MNFKIILLLSVLCLALQAAKTKPKAKPAAKPKPKPKKTKATFYATCPAGYLLNVKKECVQTKCKKKSCIKCEKD